MGERDLGDVEEFLQAGLVALEECVDRLAGFDGDFCIEAFADELGLACGFERDEDFAADFEELLPVCEKRGGVAGDDCSDVGEEGDVNTGLSAFDFGKVFPDFVGGEAEDWRDESREGFGDAPDGGLCAAAGRMVRGEGVEAVLEDVEIEGAEVSVGELVEGLVGAVELEVIVGGADACGELREAAKDVLVEGFELREGDGVSGRVEIVEIAEQEAQGVAQLAVVVADALHEVFAGGYVFAEVDGGDPEADDFAAEALGDLDRIDAVAEALGEGTALFVEGPAGGGDHFVGRGAADSNGGEERGVEPAAMLVAAFGVEVGGSVEFGLDVEDGVPACSGLKPDVEDVHLFAELGAAAVKAGGSGRQESGDIVLVPGVGAFAMEELHDALVDGRIVERLVAFFAEEDGDGHAPDALAGDAPVGAGFDHVVDALAAPGGVPDDVVDLPESALAEGGASANFRHRTLKEMNHCSVARKMTGLWQRQQCG